MATVLTPKKLNDATVGSAPPSQDYLVPFAHPATGKVKTFKYPDTEINPKDYGAKGDGITDDSWVFPLIYAAYSSGTIVFPPGNYLLKDVPVKKGFVFSARQYPKSNYTAHCPVKITAAPGATYMFVFDADAAQSAVSHLYIDGNYTNVPGLKAAVYLRGFNVHLIWNNIFNCNTRAVITECSIADIYHNFIAGHFGIPTFVDNNDPMEFIGALDITYFIDSNLELNEVSGSANYTTEKDPYGHGRCAAVAADNISLSTIERNIIENADIGFVLKLYGISNTYTANRYELNMKGGKKKYKEYYSTESKERYACNSLLTDGAYDDVWYGSDFGFNTILTPSYVKLTIGDVARSGVYHSRYGVTHLGYSNTYISGSSVDANYFTAQFNPANTPFTRYLDGDVIIRGGTYSKLAFENSSGGADQKNLDLVADATGIGGRFLNDAKSVANLWFYAARNGDDPVSIEFYGYLKARFPVFIFAADFDFADAGFYVYSGTLAGVATLPAASEANRGKAYKIKNRSSANLVINAAGGASEIYFTAQVNTITVAPGEAVEIFCDQYLWNVV